MSRVHLSLGGEWVACKAHVRACPRMLHLDNLTPRLAANLPDFYLQELLAVVDPPHEVQGRLQTWRHNGQLHRDHDLPAVFEPNRPGASPYQAWYEHGYPRRRRNGLPNRITPERWEWWAANGVLLHVEENTGAQPPAWYPTPTRQELAKVIAAGRQARAKSAR